MRMAFFPFVLYAARSLAYVPKSILVHSRLVSISSDQAISSWPPFRGSSALRQADSDEGDKSEKQPGIEEELERLQNQLSLIEALEERNKAQLDSFIDKEDQWNSLEEYEKELLNSKEKVVERMDLLAEQMIMLWMGQKSQEG